ncbi:MAG: CGNR zinc finger domain-containing protein [Microthrixaceae bacterium]
MASGDPEFEFGGRLSLDLTWTVRFRAVEPVELLRGPNALRRWITAAVAPVREPVDAADLAEAIRLREAIYRSARAVIDGEVPRGRDRRTINEWAARPAPYRQLERSGGAVTVLLPEARVGSALAAVAADAVDLLSAGDGRLRVCEGPSCSLVFHDSSRPGRRRWCSAERCGNRVNTTAYRRRRADGEPAD